ncbi:hypothetical protein J7L68_02445 [bacterium]|nr:hypothetical protein [bacterium]
MDSLIGHSHSDDFLRVTLDKLISLGLDSLFNFRTDAGREKYELLHRISDFASDTADTTE